MEASCSQTHVFFHCQTQKSPRRQHTEPPHPQRSQCLNRAAAARQCGCSRERVPNRQQQQKNVPPGTHRPSLLPSDIYDTS